MMAPSGDTLVLCDADLTETPVSRFDRRHPVVSAQKTIDRLLVSGIASFGVYRRHQCPTAPVLADIRTLGNRLLHDVLPDGLGTDLPAGLLAEYRALLTNSKPRQSGRRGKPAPALTVAVGVTGALDILKRPTVDSAAVAIRALPDCARRRLTFACQGRTGQTSVVLRAVYLTALAPEMGTCDQLRYRLGTPLPRRPVTDATRIAHMIRSLPSAFWPEWSIRLGGWQCSQHLLRPTFAIAVLLVGANLRIQDATDILGRPLTSSSAVQTLWRLKRSGYWSDIRLALIRLADYLSTHKLVIDYERRRQLDYHTLLPATEWQRIYRATNSHPAGGWVARGYLLERLRGTPRVDTAVFDTGSSAALNRFPARLTPELRRALLLHGRDFLAAHGIEDEPVHWQPPTHLLRGLDLPGRGFDAIDIGRLHHLVRHDKKTLRAAARRVDIPLDVVRLLFEERPAPAAPRRRPQTTVTVRPPGPAYQRAARGLPRERYIELYEVERRSLRDIAAMIGISRPTIAELARDYGISLRRAAGPKVHNIDREWLYTEYITNRRSLSDLARQRGVSVSCISQRLKTSGIPRRGLPWRNTAELAEKRYVPAILLPALSGQGGWERLQRFADVTRYPSYAEAATALNLCRSAIGLQVREIQQVLGRDLVIPATASTPMRLTRFGKQVVAAVQDLAEHGGP